MERRIGTKWQLVLFGWAVAGLLAFYTLGSLWDYADSLQSSYGFMLKVGFTACELSVFVWIWFHVWRNWRVTRLYCLFASVLMGIFLVVHASAVTKYLSAKKEAGAQVQQLAGGLTQITGAASQGIVTGAGQVASGQRAKGAPNTARATVKEGTQAAANVGVKNGETLANATLKLEEQAKGSTFLSPEYLNGKMFAVVFGVLLGLVGLTFLVFEMGKAEEDEDGDGVPNFADLDSQYYDAKRAKEWWGRRGQLAPHELQQQQPTTPAPSTNSGGSIGFAPMAAPTTTTAKQANTTFSTGSPGNFMPPRP